MKHQTDWKALSDSLTLHGPAYIDGGFQPAHHGETFPSVNPATEALLVQVSSCDEVDVNVAVASALKAFRNGRCSEASPARRKKTLRRLAQLATEAGIPDGVFNVVPGYGQTAGKALALHPDVNVLTFPGSTRVAGLLMEYAGQSNLKRVWIEAGGKSPMLVFEDCEDIRAAAATAAAAIFNNQGEVCIACSRLYLHSSIKERFLDALVEAAAAYQTGDPLNPKTTMGPMVDREQLATVERYIRSALDEGGQLLIGGLPEYVEGQGFYSKPTIITGAHNGMTFVREEIFGPLLAVCEFSDEAEAIELANDNDYGLAASVWTSNLSRAHRVSGKIKSGMVWVNGWATGDWTMPFGGVKASGNGRDKSLHSLEKYSEVKSVWISL